MAERFGQIDTQILIKRQDSSTSAERVVWRPLEHLDGSVLITSPSPLEFSKIEVRLEGYSRVWTDGWDNLGNLRAKKAEYKFLNQNQHNIKIAQNVSEGTSRYAVPFNFVIPLQVLENNLDTPYVCLNPPPSLQVGRVLFLGQSHEFAQPSIRYQLRVLAKVTQPEPMSAKLIDTSKEIQVMPYTEVLPPTHTHDFPAEFVESQTSNLRLSIFGRSLYAMTMTMREPAAIQRGKSSTNGETEAKIQVELEPADGKQDTVNTMTDDRLLQNLKGATFKLEGMVRIKTFYSTAPLSKLPNQAMAGKESQLRLGEMTHKLEATKMKLDSWQTLVDLVDEGKSPIDDSGRRCSFCFDNADQALEAGAESQSCPIHNGLRKPTKKLSAIIRLPVKIPHDLPSTFCSALVSRQYSLIIQVKVGGVKVQKFKMEVPLQVTHPAPESFLAAIAGDNDSSGAVQGNANSQLFDTDPVADSELPGYTR